MNIKKLKAVFLTALIVFVCGVVNAEEISGTVSGCNFCHKNYPAANVTITLASVTSGATETTTADDGTYSFMDLANDEYIVTPSMASHTARPLMFVPTSTDVTVPSAAQTGVNFAAAAEVLDEDIDDDGVPNEDDKCPETPVDEIVDTSSGCSIKQLISCEGPRENINSRGNHGRYVATSVKALKRFVRKGLITENEKKAFMKEISSSDCGKMSAYTCEAALSLKGYDKAAELDDCLLFNAQTMTANLESEDIEVLDKEYMDFGVFESNFAQINVEEKSVSPIAIFFDEDMSAYPNAPDTIDGAFVTKMVSKDKIESYFDITIDGEQGTCSDIQKRIYDNVLYKVLTREERLRYASEGKSLTILSDLTNLRDWVPIDTASLVTFEGDDYFFQPLSFYLSIHTSVKIDELLKGTKYCKLLSHQAILSWMLEKSFEDDPVLLAPNPFVCNSPSTFEPGGGSCLVYFLQAESYYCSDYTGYFFDLETGAEKCADRFDTGGGIDPVYSPKPCSERTAEIKKYILGYVGFTGACVIHCQEENEFIWNIYTENPEQSCGGWDFFTPEEVDAIK
jgi:hypothetical protein